MRLQQILRVVVAPLAAAGLLAVAPAAVGALAASANPTSVAFGGQSVRTTAPPSTITLTNTGTETLTVSGVSVGPESFARTHNCASLAVGQSCSAQVRFTPAAAGALNGSLVFQTNAGDITVPLSGTGELSLVTHYYRSILNRAPDAAGKSFWEGEAARMSGLGININETWFVMAGYFFNSGEYVAANKTNAQFVTDLYNTFFNRPPDAGGLNYWEGQIEAGLPREVVLFSFMFSPEFTSFTQQIFGNTASRPEVDMVVDFFRGFLNRLPDTTSFDYWQQRLQAAQCMDAGAVYIAVEDISLNFMYSSEYANRSRNNTGFVTDLYYAFLRRGGDLGGVQYWVNELQSSARTPNTVRQNFIASPEFGARTQAVIDAGCVSPLVDSSFPADTATQVPVTAAMTVTFSEPMDPATLTTTSFTVSGPTGLVPATVSASGNTATLTPHARLVTDAAYTLTVTTDARNPAGYHLAKTYVAHFTTRADEPPPIVAGCPTPPSTSQLRRLEWGTTPVLKRKSGEITSFRVAQSQAGKASTTYTQGQVASTPPSPTIELTVSRCPGVIEPDLPSNCRYVSNTPLAARITAFNRALTEYGLYTQEDHASQGCLAPNTEQHYVNVRWTFADCPIGVEQCGFSLQWGEGAY